jgi:hypothetical protein
MARYRALSNLFVGRRLIKPGEEFESDLVPGLNWEPLDDAARAAKAAAERLYEILPNGLQTRDRATGRMRNVT